MIDDKFVVKVLNIKGEQQSRVLTKLDMWSPKVTKYLQIFGSGQKLLPLWASVSSLNESLSPGKLNGLP